LPENSLHLNQTLRQEQILAPAQLQSLEYLIAPVMELQSKISEELETNPVLEQEKNDIEKKSESLESNELTSETPVGKEEAEYTADEDFPNLEEMTERWNDYLPPTPINTDINTENEKYTHFFNSIIATQSIEEQLLSQLSFTEVDDNFKELCKLIIGSINEIGYFQGSLQDLAVIGGSDADVMEKALNFVQSFDPPGIAARDLKECLYLQLERDGKENTVAAKIVLNYLDELALNHLPQIAKLIHVSLDELKESIAEIRKLTPYPWIDNYSKNNSAVIIPELAIEKIENQYVIILKNEYIPRLRISKKYMGMLENPSTSDDTKEYIKNKMLKGNLIIKNIQQRQETIRKIAEIIIDSQYDFLEEGIEHLKPLTMKEVADKIGVHETTVSRAVANKYVETPQGVFEMRYFFSTGYQSDSGEVISNRSVMEKIKDIVADENTLKPYSDDAISKMLKDQGLNVARRTVTKYREETGIPSSRQRKEFV
jgi:RNA polymerase sigma-54 factor